MAHAGGDMMVAIGDTITLDGSKSYDPNGSIISYNWNQSSGPAVIIQDSTATIASFVIPKVNRTSNFIFQL